jgi:hypothetical protein
VDWERFTAIAVLEQGLQRSNSPVLCSQSHERWHPHGLVLPSQQVGKDGDKAPQELPDCGPIVVLDGLSELVVSMVNAGLRAVGADRRGGRFVHGINRRANSPGRWWQVGMDEGAPTIASSIGKFKKSLANGVKGSACRQQPHFSRVRTDLRTNTN